jgi:hypothetical protein
MIVLACVLALLLVASVNADCRVVVAVVGDEYPDEVSYQIQDTNGAVVFDVSEGSLQYQPTTARSVTVAAGDYTFTITDSYDDGICCSHGSGTYMLDIDGTYIQSPTGGNYGAGETLSFSCEP